MKQSWLLLILLVSSVAAFGQIKYEPGYFISNDGQRTECEIKNLDWQSNPTTFEYRVNGTDGRGGIETISEFGITGGSVFRRFEVSIDRSSNNTSSLGKERNPDFKRETLFLRLLVNGKAVLYMYEDQGLIRFFCSNDGSAVTQLVYKRYIQTNERGWTTGYVLENEQYKQDLLNSLKCASITERDVKSLKYERASLMKFFNRYNECNGTLVQTNEVGTPKSPVHISLLVGAGFNSLASQYTGAPVTTYESAVALRLGAEFEIVLASNKGMWAVVLQTVYQTYSTKNAPGTITVNYSSLDVGGIVRRYLFIKDNNSLYANLGGVFAVPISSEDTFKGPGTSLESNLAVNFVLGLGYRVSKFSAELSYAANRDILQKYPYWSAPYGGVIVTLGYRLK